MKDPNIALLKAVRDVGLEVEPVTGEWPCSKGRYFREKKEKMLGRNDCNSYPYVFLRDHNIKDKLLLFPDLKTYHNLKTCSLYEFASSLIII